MSSNVVVFPKDKKNSPPQSLQEMHNSIEALRKERIELTIDTVVPNLFMSLLQEGFDLSLTESGVKDSALIIESVKAALYRSMDFKHGLQAISDKLFVVKEDEEGTTVVKVDSGEDDEDIEDETNA
jgi:hypothetical protein